MVDVNSENSEKVGKADLLSLGASVVGNRV